LPWRPFDRAVADRVGALATRARDPVAYVESRSGTAATLRALDDAAGGGFFEVPADAVHDQAAADACFGARPSDPPVVDVQTHLVDPARFAGPGGAALDAFLRMVDPQRWGDGVDGRHLTAARWAAHVFGGSETAVALLTALPGLAEQRVLANDEIAACRDLVDRYGGTGRLLTHTIVHPNLDGELERLAVWRDELRPSAWKVYTLWGPAGAGGWFLDDELGHAFLERVRDVGPRIVCAHKGIAGPVPEATPATSSPRDVGPAARAFPDVQFVVYHSGYDVDPNGEEGPETEGRGVGRLVESLRGARIGPGANVWAELGSTWFLVVRRPREAAHVLGKLLLAVGENRVLWGTDSVWYGPPQPLVDALRAFTIPGWMQEEFGYPPLTPAIKAKILGGNAAALYGLDLGRFAAEEPGRREWVDGLRAELRARFG
jgi:predicted TIM-barrel fold metal-dependent hydrolase